MKNTLIIICSLLAVPIVLLAALILYLSTERYCFNKSITTEYGDTFIVNCDDFLHKGLLLDENGNHISSMRFYGEEPDIIGIWNTLELRCYQIGTEIILSRNTVEKFEIFDRDLYSNEDMVPIVQSFLFRNEDNLDTYLPYFLEVFPAETKTMLWDFINCKYETLFEYGLTSEVIEDEHYLDYMLDTVEFYLYQQVLNELTS